MAGSYYINPDRPDDTGNGLSWATAKKTIQGLVDILTGPVEGETKVYLAADATAAFSGDVQMRGISAIGEDAKLVFEPRSTDNSTVVWNEDNYEGHTYSPFESTETGAFDITADDKPVELPLQFDIRDCRHVEFRGFKIIGTSGFVLAQLTLINSASGVKFVYCRHEEKSTGIASLGNSNVDAENCYFLRNNVAVYAGHGGNFNLIGNNYIVEPYKHGILGWMGGNLLVSPWDESFDYYTTEVRTNLSRPSFEAIKLVGKSVMSIWQGFGLLDEISIGKVRVYNANRVLSPKYLGVVLESQSMVVGASQFEFLTLNAKSEDQNMPAAQRFVAARGERCLVIG